MKKLAILFCMLFCVPVKAAVGPSLDTSLSTGPIPISSVMTDTEQKVRSAAVKVLTPQGHGSGSLVKYKGLTLLFTANHVTDGTLGDVYAAAANGETKMAMLIYADPAHDLAILYMLEQFESVKPLKYSPREKLIEVGKEITYSGYPSSHQLMTFRGRVAGYEVITVSGTQILLHTHGWFGCSGALVYDSNSEIVGILWGIDVESRPELQVVGNLIWIQPIQALNIDHALLALCTSDVIKARACR
tara:strand:+ start:8839 stop:9573 length:735 start_codon:yes stop_codon:yes gene_type:complete